MFYNRYGCLTEVHEYSTVVMYQFQETRARETKDLAEKRA